MNYQLLFCGLFCCSRPVSRESRKKHCEVKLKKIIFRPIILSRTLNTIHVHLNFGYMLLGIRPLCFPTLIISLRFINPSLSVVFVRANMSFLICHRHRPRRRTNIISLIFCANRGRRLSGYCSG